MRKKNRREIEIEILKEGENRGREGERKRDEDSEMGDENRLWFGRRPIVFLSSVKGFILAFFDILSSFFNPLLSSPCYVCHVGASFPTSSEAIFLNIFLRTSQANTHIDVFAGIEPLKLYQYITFY